MNGKWNRYHENLLKKWSQMSKTYSIMHSLCAQYYAKWHKRLGIPVVIIGGVTASSIFSSKKEDSEVWTYVNGSLALLVAALAGVSSFIGTAEKTTKHQNASFKYTKISLDIDVLLSFGRHERPYTPQEFIQSAKSEMLDIRENVPEVLSWVMNDYLKKFDKSLTNTKCKINKHSVLQQPSYSSVLKQPITYQYEQHQPPSCKSTGTFNTVECSLPTREEDDIQLGQTNVETKANTSKGELLLDFDDKQSTNIVLASERMQELQSESSEFIESESETEE